MFVHGDDYVSTTMPEQLRWMQRKLEEKYQIKTQWLGPGSEHQREVNILNRIIGWHDKKGISFKTDPRHAEIIIEQFKFKEAKSASSPGTKEEGTTAEYHEQELEESQASQYRAITARCNYISPDRPDIVFTVKELARKMSRPTRGDWTKLKRLGRYILGKPRLQQIYPWQDTQNTLKVFTDADWAGCREIRKSTTGGCVMLDKHTIKGWSKTQTFIALSSGESEVYAALKASTEALGLVSLLRDLGYTVKGEIWGGSSAALGIINRKGLGKTRHIETRSLWIQQTVAERRLRYAKVLGKENPADLYTKFLDAATCAKHIQKFEYEFIDGRSSETPNLHTLTGTTTEFGHEDDDELCEWVQTILQHVEVNKSLRKHQKARGSLNNVMDGTQNNTDGPTNIQRNEYSILSDTVKNVFPLREANQESSTALTRTIVHMRQLTGSPRDTEQLGVAEKQKVNAPTVKGKQQLSQSLHNRRLPLQFESARRTPSNCSISLPRLTKMQCESLRGQGIA